jgi:glycyl-tRNA synthetase
MVLLDAAILMNPQVWVASGHVGGFSDPLIDDKNTKERFRADKLMETSFHERAEAGTSRADQQTDYTKKYGVNNMVPESWTPEQQFSFMVGEDIRNPNNPKVKADWTEIRKFNLMFKTSQGVTDDSSALVYLRPETAQGIFVDFPSIVRTCRRRVPFGVAQVGKAFRNEITPGNFIFRTREFEQMEIEFFCEPGTQKEWHEKWKVDCKKFLMDTIGIRESNLRFREHEKDELSHYSDGTYDIEYDFPSIGFSELQ